MDTDRRRNEGTRGRGRPRLRAVVTLGGAAASLVALPLVGPVCAGVIALGTLWFSSRGPAVIGTTPVRASTPVDPRAVRRYRESHPGATITEAVAAVTRP